jgi:hypothetical protein
VVSAVYAGFPVTPVARSIAVPSASIFPMSSYQSGAPLVPSSPCRTPFSTSAAKCLTQARAMLPSGFLYSWKSTVTDQVPSKVLSVEAAFVFCANRSVETANMIVIRDAYFISIPNLTNRNMLISPRIFYFQLSLLFKLSGWYNLTSIDGLKGLRKLKTLNIRNCDNLTSVAGLNNLKKKLRELDLPTIYQFPAGALDELQKQLPQTYISAPYIEPIYPPADPDEL